MLFFIVTLLIPLREVKSHLPRPESGLPYDLLASHKNMVDVTLSGSSGYVTKAMELVPGSPGTLALEKPSTEEAV